MPNAVPALRELQEKLQAEGISADPVQVAGVLLEIARGKITAKDNSPLAAWVRQLGLDVLHTKTLPDIALPDMPPPRKP